MKGPRKLSQKISMNFTYEMAMWLDGLVVESGADGRGAVIRSMLQTIMDDDIRAHANDAPPQLKVVEGRG